LRGLHVRMQQIVQHCVLDLCFVRSACIVWVVCVNVTDRAALCSGFTFCKERKHYMGVCCNELCSAILHKSMCCVCMHELVWCKCVSATFAHAVHVLYVILRGALLLTGSKCIQKPSTHDHKIKISRHHSHCAIIPSSFPMLSQSHYSRGHHNLLYSRGHHNLMPFFPSAKSMVLV